MKGVVAWMMVAMVILGWMTNPAESSPVDTEEQVGIHTHEFGDDVNRSVESVDGVESTSSTEHPAAQVEEGDPGVREVGANETETEVDGTERGQEMDAGVTHDQNNSDSVQVESVEQASTLGENETVRDTSNVTTSVEETVHAGTEEGNSTTEAGVVKEVQDHEEVEEHKETVHFGGEEDNSTTEGEVKDGPGHEEVDDQKDQTGNEEVTSHEEEGTHENDERVGENSEGDSENSEHIEGEGEDREAKGKEDDDDREAKEGNDDDDGEENKEDAKDEKDDYDDYNDVVKGEDDEKDGNDEDEEEDDEEDEEEEAEGPRIERVRSSDSIEKIVVEGSGFSMLTSCQVAGTEIEEFNERAEFVSESQVVCLLPKDIMTKNGAFVVKVSNDGTRYSEPHQFDPRDLRTSSSSQQGSGRPFALVAILFGDLIILYMVYKGYHYCIRPLLQQSSGYQSLPRTRSGGPVLSSLPVKGM